MDFESPQHPISYSRFEDTVKAPIYSYVSKNSRCAFDDNKLLRFHCIILACSLGISNSTSLCSTTYSCHNFKCNTESARTTTRISRISPLLVECVVRSLFSTALRLVTIVLLGPSHLGAWSYQSEQWETPLSISAFSWGSNQIPQLWCTLGFWLFFLFVLIFN